MKKVIIYTDSPFFAGCENILENIVLSPKISSEFDVLYSYAYNRRYQSELRTRRDISVPLVAIPVLSNSSIFSNIKKVFGKSFLEKLIRVPFSIMERLYLYEPINYFILCRFIKKHSPDIVHINNGGYPGSQSCRTMALAAKAAGVNKILFTVNNMAVPQNSFFDRFLDKKISEAVDVFTTASKAAATQLAGVRGFNAAKLLAIPNTILKDGLNICVRPRLRREFNISSDIIIIGSVGLLIRRKGYHVLIEAARKVKGSSKWMILIFGEGEERDYLESLIYKYNLADKIHLPGFRKNIMDYVADFDVFVLPSLNNEDFPNVINEAMCLSKPIIVTSVGGMTEQIRDGENGFLIEPNNVTELTCALSEIINSQYDRRRNMGNASKKIYMDNFSYEKSVNKYYDLYNNLCS